MNKILTAAALAAGYAAVFAGPAMAEIVSVSATGPGGTVSPLDIGTTVNTDDTVIYGSNYTAAAPIYITLTLGGGDSNTQFFVVQSPNFLANNSGVVFRNFYVDLVSAPRGTTFNEAGSAGNAFGTPIFNAGMTGMVFPGVPALPGGPGLPSGFVTQIGVGFTLASPADRTETVVLYLSPTPVPEPSTWAMMTLGFAGLGFAGYRATRARRSVMA
jgi:PEP-CTERM motif